MTKEIQLQLAKELCVAAHKEQTDKGGKEYYLHPFAVASLVDTIDEKIVAYLHDTVEDTWVTIDILKEKGFDNTILDAVKAITHDKTKSYKEYIDVVRTNKIATVVKIADLIHNSDLSRIPVLTKKDYERVTMYKHYINILRQGETINL